MERSSAPCLSAEMTELAQILDRAMREPGLQGTPDAAMAIDLVAQGLFRVAHGVLRLEERIEDLETRLNEQPE